MGGGGGREWVPGLMSRGRDPYSEVQCIMGNGHMGPTPLPMDGQTDTCENISIPQLHWRGCKNVSGIALLGIFSLIISSQILRTDWLVEQSQDEPVA